MIGTGLARWESPLLPSQLQVWGDLESANILFSGAYRAGKSELCCRLALRHAIIHQRSRVGIFRNYLKSIKQSTLITLLSLTDPNLVADWSNSELILTLVNGSRISFFGCDDPDRMGSVELSFGFIDEVHEISDESYTMIRGRLSLQPPVWEPYRDSPYVATVRQLICAANPKAKNHHLYQRFWGGRAGHKVYFGNTLENHYLPKDYVANLVSSYTRPGVTLEQVNKLMENPDRDMRLADLANLFNSHGRRNLLGLWGSSDQQWYPDFELAIVDKLPAHFEYIIAGIDWGYNDPRFCKIGLSDGKWYTFGYWAPAKLTPDDFIAGVAERMAGTNFCYAPPDQPGLIRQLKRLVPRIRKAKNAVLPGISAVASAMGKTLFFYADGSNDWLICQDEFIGYERKIDSKTGEITDTPNKIQDHMPDCVRYAFYSHIVRSRSHSTESYDDDD